MVEEQQRSIAEKWADNALLQSALERATREALLSHARAGRAVPVSSNGKIVWLTPEQVIAMYPEATVAQSS